MVTINKQIAASTDDCYEVGGGYNDNGSVVYIGNYYGTIYEAGLRWTSVNIPNSATISSAKLSGHIAGDIGTLEANVRGIDEDNTATWSTGSRPSQRTKTTATINANEANWNNWAVGNWADIDITSVIQEIVNRGGWAANNALAVMIENTAAAGNSQISFSTYDSGSLSGAKLDIVYVVGGASPTSVFLGPLGGPFGGPIQ